MSEFPVIRIERVGVLDKFDDHSELPNWSAEILTREVFNTNLVSQFGPEACRRYSHSGSSLNKPGEAWGVTSREHLGEFDSREDAQEAVKNSLESGGLGPWLRPFFMYAWVSIISGLPFSGHRHKKRAAPRAANEAALEVFRKEEGFVFSYLSLPYPGGRFPVVRVRISRCSLLLQP